MKKRLIENPIAVLGFLISVSASAHANSLWLSCDLTYSVVHVSTDVVKNIHGGNFYKYIDLSNSSMSDYDYQSGKFGTPHALTVDAHSFRWGAGVNSSSPFDNGFIDRSTGEYHYGGELAGEVMIVVRGACTKIGGPPPIPQPKF
jgi:hypothetical protein